MNWNLVFDASEWWQTYWWVIIVAILASIFALWLLVLIITTVFFSIFSRRTKHLSIALNMLINERRTSILNIVSFLENNDMQIEESDIESINKLSLINDFQMLGKDDRDERILSFTHGCSNILNKASLVEKINCSSDYKNLVSIYEDVENSYRQKVAKYNTDVAGYNYWINIPTNRFIFKALKKKPLDLVI